MALSLHGKLVTLAPVAVVVMLLCADAVQATVYCSAGQRNCNGCVNPQTDANNCGNCGVKCTAFANAHTQCNMGRCEHACKPEYKNCDGKWENGCECEPSTDVDNCGVCGTKCIAPPKASAKCYMGRCEYTCHPGYKNCDGKWENGCECEPSTDVDNCGECGTKCIAGPKASAKCYMGKCEYTCLPGYKNCDGKWENGCECEPTTDVDNCGECGTKCIAPPKASAKCYMGKCEYTCLPGYKNCDGKWENGCECAIDTDPQNCGDCNVKCSEVANAYSMCQGKQCVYTCKPGWANCDKDWKNGCECYPETDPKNCGSCSSKCAEPKYYGGEARCTKGKCGDGCKTGMKYNNGKKSCDKDGDDDGKKGNDGGDDGKKGDGDDDGKKGNGDDDNGKKGKKGGDDGKRGNKGGDKKGDD